MDKLKCFADMAGCVMSANAAKLDSTFIDLDDPAFKGSV